jgi:hypothetical protein
MKVLYDSLSRNTGDIAIGLASRDLLASRGVIAENVNPFHTRNSGTHLIGGGELIRTSHNHFYDHFRLPGDHILNAVGVNYAADQLDYLRGYRFVSARSSREAEVLEKFVPNVEVLPCATTLWGKQIARSMHKESEPTLGIHLVPHSYRVIEGLSQLINSIQMRKVFFSFTPYNGDIEFMRALPLDLTNSSFAVAGSPEEVFHQIGQFSSVITTSLHASIFAYTQNIPFVSIKQTKVFDYFRDRDLARNVVGDRLEFQASLDRLFSGEEDYEASVQRDCAAVAAAFDQYVHLAEPSQKLATPEAMQEVFGFQDSEEARALQLVQSRQVIVDHDLVFAHADARRREAETALENLRDILKKIKRNPFHLFKIYLVSMQNALRILRKKN